MIYICIYMYSMIHPYYDTLLWTCYIFVLRLFHRRRALSPWCPTESSFLQFNLIIELTRKIYTTRDRLSKIHAVLQDGIIETVPIRSETAHIWIFLRQRAPIYLGLAWRSRRRCILVISRYISYHVYLHIIVPDSLARRKPWVLTIPSRTCWYLLNKYAFFLFINM